MKSHTQIFCPGVVVGAPSEDGNKGSIYLPNGQRVAAPADNIKGFGICMDANNEYIVVGAREVGGMYIYQVKSLSLN